MTEAFVYLWYDAPNDMYYLGKHKGSPDDTYTHSSTVWESFTKDNIPEGVTRRILAYGTDEEMCILEHELLVNRKKRCWNRYYNESLGDPRYVDQWGENNPMYGKTWGGRRTGENNPNWKGGIKVNDPVAYQKALEQTPERKAYMKAYRATPDRIAYMKALEQTPERKAYKKAYRAKKKSETQGESTLEPFFKKRG